MIFKIVLANRTAEEEGNISSQELHFFYDSQSKPAFVEFEGERYRYVHSLQGDIIAIVDSAGNTVVKYKYNAWGKQTIARLFSDSEIARLSTFAYRGYMYDVDANIYYLRDRYYCDEVGRFINSDTLIQTGKGFGGSNLYTYCGNEPIRHCDPSGRRYIITTSVQNEDSRSRHLALQSTKERIHSTINKRKCGKVDPVVRYNYLMNSGENFQTLHYNRNLLQGEFPEKYSEEYFSDWDDTVAADCHQFSSEDRSNKKYVCPNGCCEAIYNSEGFLVLDPRDIGTYNFFSPSEEPILHFVFDVLPWIRWGNSPDDTTAPEERIAGMLGKLN